MRHFVINATSCAITRKGYDQTHHPHTLRPAEQHLKSSKPAPKRWTTKPRTSMKPHKKPKPLPCALSTTSLEKPSKLTPKNPRKILKNPVTTYENETRVEGLHFGGQSRILRQSAGQTQQTLGCDKTINKDVAGLDENHHHEVQAKTPSSHPKTGSIWRWRTFLMIKSTKIEDNVSFRNSAGPQLYMLCYVYKSRRVLLRNVTNSETVLVFWVQ